MRPNVFCTAIRTGGQKEFDFSYAQYQKTNDTAFKRDISAGLACTKELWLIEKYLNYQNSVNNTLQSLRNVAVKPFANTVAWKFLRAYWNSIYNRYCTILFIFKEV